MHDEHTLLAVPSDTPVRLADGGLCARKAKHLHWRAIAARVPTPPQSTVARRLCLVEATADDCRDVGIAFFIYHAFKPQFLNLSLAARANGDYSEVATRAKSLACIAAANSGCA